MLFRSVIELNVSPKKSRGFDEIAATIAAFDEVESVLLMSGGYRSEERRVGKECLLRAEWGGKLQKPGANRPLVCYTDRNIATG